MQVVEFPVPQKNDELIECAENLLEQAKSGDLRAAVIVKFDVQERFMILKVGDISDLTVCGALDFAKYDIVTSNIPKENR